MEHHDFATVPWTRLPALSQLAPEFYHADHAACAANDASRSWIAAHPPVAVISSLYSGLILPWLRTRGKKFDFACRENSLFHIVNRMRMAEAVREQLGLPPLSGPAEESDNDEDDAEEDAEVSFRGPYQVRSEAQGNRSPPPTATAAR